MSEYIHMTPEELKNNYQFIITRRLLMKDFPWIKNVLPPDDDINKYGLIFLNLIVDPYELAKERDWRVAWFIKSYLQPGLMRGTFWSPYLSTMFASGSEGASSETRELESYMNKIASSPAIPQDIKLPRGRKFSVGKVIMDPNSTYLREYDEDPDQGLVVGASL